MKGDKTMHEKVYDVAVIGGGPAGLAAAVAAADEGAKNVVIIERDFCLGGILEQCIHVGFGLKYFGEELSGPEYAQRFIDMAVERGIQTMMNTMVLGINPETKKIQAVNAENGSFYLHAKAIILSMGCRERTRAAISIPGTRPAGIFTAGTAQRFINIQNAVIGKKVVILGSGDIGMIMARRLTLENVKVEAVVEILPYLAGLTRNKVQCLDDFKIPLLLGHTITDIKGKERVTSVTVAEVDQAGQPVTSSEREILCDTVMLSVGLIPENELTKKCGIEIDPITNGPFVDSYMQTSIPGIFACGNVVHVNDLVDRVSEESNTAGKYAYRYAAGTLFDERRKFIVKAGNGIRYVVPNSLKTDNNRREINLYMRVRYPEKHMVLQARQGEKVLFEVKKARVSPGEMEHITIAVDDLSETDINEIIISLNEDC